MIFTRSLAGVAKPVPKIITKSITERSTTSCPQDQDSPAVFAGQTCPGQVPDRLDLPPLGPQAPHLSDLSVPLGTDSRTGEGAGLSADSANYTATRSTISTNNAATPAAPRSPQGGPDAAAQHAPDRPPAPVRVWRPVPAGLGPNGKRTASRRVEITLPYRHGTRGWLRSVCGAGSRPEFDRDRKVWLVSRPHFLAVVAALVDEYGEVDVYADHTARSACGALCRDAVGDECDCSCLGENHGGQTWRKEWIKLSEEWLMLNVKVRTHYRVDAAGWHRPAGSAR